MKRTILYPLLTLYLLIFSNGQAIASGNDSIRLSLLTCAPGEEIYSLFGHTSRKGVASQSGTTPFL